MMRTLLTTLLVLAGCGGATVDPVDAAHGPDAHLDDDAGGESGADGGQAPDAFALALESLRAEHEIPALAALELQDGEVRRRGAVGVRRNDGDEPVSLDDRWHIGSCTKAMTAALVALVAEDGTPGFDTTLEAAFPDLEIDEAMRGITLHQLLVHRGGLADDRAPTPEIIELLTIEGPPQEARAEVARRLLARPPAVTPDTEMRYSNLGYVLIAAALERATGESWEALTEARIFAPLEMSSCGFGPPAATSADAPSGHVEGEGGLTPVPTVDNPPLLGPAGTVHCSLADWARFVDWVMAPPTSGPLAVSEAAVARLRTPSADGFAPGWIVTSRDWASGPILAHSGSNGTFFAVAWVAPEERRAFFAAVNAGTTGAMTAADAAIATMITSE